MIPEAHLYISSVWGQVVLVGVLETRNYSSINSKSWVHNCCICCESSYLAKEDDERLRPWTNISYQDHVWQQFNNFNFKKSVFRGRTKHIKIKFYFIREVQQSNEVLLVHCSSENQLADIFTNSLPKERFEDLKQRIGVCHKNAKEEC